MQTTSEIGEKGFGPELGKLPKGVDGLLGGGEPFFALAQVEEADAEVIQAHRQIGEEDVGPVLASSR